MAKKNPASQQHKTNKQGFAEALTNWYKYDHRQLPWRETTNPYHIWLSEIMLQQTQVVTVLPYYDKFLKQFPTIKDLARADLNTVLKAWEGLGYYSRCRNLHKAAQLIVEQHDGIFPKTIEAVEALPGIGKSTAGAILTFSFGQKHPLLDGNVKRVLSRLYDINEVISSTKLQNSLWEYSTALLEETDDPYSYNQAIMELGATLCSRTKPSCLLCLVRTFCDAAENGTQELRPVKLETRKIPHYNIGVGVIQNQQGQVFIQKRPEEGLLGGLWEFPGGKQENDEAIEKTVLREIKEELELNVDLGEPITTVKHAYSHFKITLYAYHCKLQSGEPKPKACEQWKWVEPTDLKLFPFPKANKKVLEVLEEELLANIHN